MFEQRVVMPIGQLQTFKLVRVDDFVISLRSFQGGIEYSDYQGLVSPAYTVLRKHRNVNSQYFKWLFKSTPFISELNSSVTGIRQGKNIDPETFLTSVLPIPAMSEQKRIAEFLDRKCGEIDEAIAKKQRLIQLLEEQKTILINQAVTKGLNPDAPMKDSGIEWLGEIPEHWDMSKLGFLSHLLQTGPFGSQLHQEEYIDSGIPIINPSQLINGKIVANNKLTVSEIIANRLQRHKLQQGDIVFGRRGEMGRCGLVEIEQIGWICGTGSILFRPRKEVIDPEFALTFLMSFTIKNYLEFVSVGATMDNLNTAILSKLFVPIPPINEQKQIITFIEKINYDFQKISNNIQTSIEQLAELKQILIAEAVTGKIKI